MLSANTSVLSIKFVRRNKKRPQHNAKHCRICEYTKTTGNADSNSAKNYFAFWGRIAIKHGLTVNCACTPRSAMSSVTLKLRTSTRSYSELAHSPPHSTWSGKETHNSNNKAADVMRDGKHKYPGACRWRLCWSWTTRCRTDALQRSLTGTHRVEGLASLNKAPH